MIRVRNRIGNATTTDLEYYAEAEPRLLQLREDFRAGKKTREEVLIIVGRVCGEKAVERDMAKLTSPPGSIDQIDEFIACQEEDPLRCRLYGYPGVVAALVLAPPDATEVEVVVY